MSGHTAPRVDRRVEVIAVLPSPIVAAQCGEDFTLVRLAEQDARERESI
jgi:hypothetical protein